MITLQVYVTDTCWTCQESHRLLDALAPHFPGVEMQLVDLDDADRPQDVFAAPTYVLNGRVISLGNPTFDILYQKLRQAQKAEQVP